MEWGGGLPLHGRLSMLVKKRKTRVKGIFSRKGDFTRKMQSMGSTTTGEGGSSKDKNSKKKTLENKRSFFSDQ